MTAAENYLHSSYREMLLEYLFVGQIMRHLWLRRYERVEVLKAQVDDAGYDIVLETSAVVRHIQLKSSYEDASTSRVNINTALENKPSGRVIWIFLDPKTLELGPFLWFGGKPGEPLSDLSGFKVAKHAKANAQGVKGARRSMQTIPKSRFEKMETIEELVDRLFGTSDKGALADAR